MIEEGLKLQSCNLYKQDRILDDRKEDHTFQREKERERERLREGVIQFYSDYPKLKIVKQDVYNSTNIHKRGNYRITPFNVIIEVLHLVGT